MPIPKRYLADFEEKEIYHVYNRTNNHELLFLSDENKRFFLKRYSEILSPFVDTFCWSLLSNHFHFLIRIKPQSAIKIFLQDKAKKYLTSTEKDFIQNKIPISKLMEHEFTRFFQSYALAFYKAHNRKGNLFYKPFKRVRIDKDSQFTMAIIYVHANAMKHRLVTDFQNYKWSSWQTLLSDQPTLLMRKEVIEWFGNLEECIKAHLEMINFYYDFPDSLEE